MRRVLPVLLLALLLLTGCTGGREIESGLFVISLAVDPAPDGNLTVTIKALSGSLQERPESDQKESPPEDKTLEDTEPGYIVLSATAPSCLRAFGLLRATTPRSLNLSQLREVVLNRALAETDATLPILREIYAMFRANGEAIVVVTPGNAGDFIRRQHAILGLRLSSYLKFLFEHFRKIDIIPPRPNLSAVITSMESGTIDAAAVYAAGNDFEAPLILPGASETDRLPGHLPRTAPAKNEYMGAALFDGAHMTDVLTGDETGLLCLMMGQAKTRMTVLDGAQYKSVVNARVKRDILPDGTLHVRITLRLTLAAGTAHRTAGMMAADIERRCTAVLQKMQAASSDAAGFGRLAVRSFPDIPSWENSNWDNRYDRAPVRVSVDVKLQ